ncbi:MAG: hypothetical protein HYZ17_05455 [Betaproteobacteria bacterium]|nr:hypothetical protein [Betaproteobacteria bacterium]
MDNVQYRVEEFLRGYLPRNASGRFRGRAYRRVLVALYFTFCLSMVIVGGNVTESRHLGTLTLFAFLTALTGGFAIGAASGWPELQKAPTSALIVQRIAGVAMCSFYLTRMVPLTQAAAWLHQYRSGVEVFVLEWTAREPLRAEFSALGAVAFTLLAWSSMILMVVMCFGCWRKEQAQ